jgi:hypothetical protein
VLGVALCTDLRAQTCAEVFANSAPPNIPRGAAGDEYSTNSFIRLFAFADLQLETKAQAREIKRALMDAQTLPLDQLRAASYAEPGMQANQWTFGRLIMAYIYSVSASCSGDYVDFEGEQFIADVKKPEALPTLKRLLTFIDSAIEAGAGE